MIKTLSDNATYEPSKRSANWFKFKRDYMNTGNLADSLDLVVVGADWGKGKRTGVFGSFLVACYDEETGGL
jgi:DNA ligase-1